MPKTADERLRRSVKYLRSCHKGQLAEFKLTRLNRMGNLRKQLRELIDQLIEERAEDLAAGMLMEAAPERPAANELRALPAQITAPKKKPVWVENEGRALKAG